MKLHHGWEKSKYFLSTLYIPSALKLYLCNSHEVKLKIYRMIDVRSQFVCGFANPDQVCSAERCGVSMVIILLPSKQVYLNGLPFMEWMSALASLDLGFPRHQSGCALSMVGETGTHREARVPGDRAEDSILREDLSPLSLSIREPEYILQMH